MRILLAWLSCGNISECRTRLRTRPEPADISDHDRRAGELRRQRSSGSRRKKVEALARRTGPSPHLCLVVSLFWRRKMLHSRLSPPQREEPMASSETKKCAHPVCTCQVTSEEYCSTQCETMEDMPDLDCKCSHSVCKGRTEYAAHA